MPLSPKKVIENQLITDRHGKPIKPLSQNATTIDVTVREVLTLGQDRKNKHTVYSSSAAILAPQETAYLISEEIIKVPDGYIAYVFLKNRLSQKGLLAFNTGIIDTGYHGPISTLVTNLSKIPAPIPILNKDCEEERAFFRIVFHEISNEQAVPAITRTHDYLEYKQQRVKELENIPKTFLDPEKTKEQINLELTDKLSNFLVGRMAVIITFLALLLGILPLGIKAYEAFENYPYPTKEHLQSLESRIKALEKKVRDTSD